MIPIDIQKKKEQFQAIQAAYEVLSDPEKRKNYDIDLLSSEDRFTIFSPLLRDSLDTSTTSNALILYHAEDFLSTLIKSKPTDWVLLDFAKKDISIAELIVKNIKQFENVVSKINFLIDVGCCYEAIGLGLISKQEIRGRMLDFHCYKLALSSEKVCKAILQTEELSIKFNGEQLLNLKQKYGEQVCVHFSEKVKAVLDAYENLLLHDKDLVNSFDLLIKARLNQSELLRLAKENIQIARLAVDRLGSLLNIFDYMYILIRLGCYYEDIGLEMVQTQWLKETMPDSYWYELALSSEKVCEAILQIVELSIHFNGSQLFALKQKYGEQVYAHTFTWIIETLSAYEAYLSNHESLINDFNLLIKARLNQDELLRLAKTNIQTANLLINYLWYFFRPFNCSFFLEELGCHYENIGLWLVSMWHETTITYLVSWYKLALSSEKVCAAILKTEELAQIINGEELLSLVKKYEKIMELIINSSALYEKLQAHILLTSVKDDAKNTC